MKSEKKNLKSRIKELQAKDSELRLKAEKLLQQGQALQQSIAQINTERIKTQGALEELGRQIVIIPPTKE